jgi:hypothetical protein
MTGNRRSFWLTLAVINLSIVAFLGFILRSKILFPLDFIDFRSTLSAHSHFAFAGWAGLSLLTLLIYDILPEVSNKKKIYQWVLALIEISSLGMAFLFPFLGYTGITIFFSTLYVVAVVVFVPVFMKDVLQNVSDKNVKLLSISALLSLMLSFLGTIGLSYIILTRSGGSLLYRDSIYTFLHFQYNGFFILAAFALLLNYIVTKGAVSDKNAKWFSVFLCLSIVPTLFLSLLWHNKNFFYFIGALGCVMILLSLFYFFRFLKTIRFNNYYLTGIAKSFLIFSIMSFLLKMLLQVGTIFPQLGNAVYGDRPIIIGFLHLVFLGFLTFFILSTLIRDEFFTRKNKIISLPLVIFAIGVLANESFLMLQGFGILLKTNHGVYNWLLWGTAFVLFTGAFLIALSRIYIISTRKNKAII